MTLTRHFGEFLQQANQNYEDIRDFPRQGDLDKWDKLKTAHETLYKEFLDSFAFSMDFETAREARNRLDAVKSRIMGRENHLSRMGQKNLIKYSP